MNKQDFLIDLEKGLAGLPREDVEERLAFYSEMIDDRAEETGSEEAAVSEIGPVEDVVRVDVPVRQRRLLALHHSLDRDARWSRHPK